MLILFREITKLSMKSLHRLYFFAFEAPPPPPPLTNFNMLTNSAPLLVAIQRINLFRKTVMLAHFCPVYTICSFVLITFVLK